MSEKRTVKTAVIGLGNWGRHHADLYADHSRASLELVCDRDADRARSLAREYGCRWTTRVEEVAASDIEAVSVATPDHTHYPIVLALLDEGKHLLVEKPLATDLRQAREMADAARRANVVAMVDFHLRWRPQFLEVKHQLLNNELGKPVMGYVRLSDTIRVASQWLSWAGASGPEWFLYSHSMDLVTWLLDRQPRGFFSRGRRGILAAQGLDCWDAIQTSVDYGDCFITFETSWVVPDAHPSVTDNDFVLYGEQGRIAYENTSGLRLASEGYLELPAPVIGRRDFFGQLSHFIYEPMRYFLNAVQGQVKPFSTFDEGALNVAMITAAVRSLDLGREVRLEEVLDVDHGSQELADAEASR